MCLNAILPILYHTIHLLLGNILVDLLEYLFALMFHWVLEINLGDVLAVLTMNLAIVFLDNFMTVIRRRLLA